jgi:hypothetical protein
MDYANADSFGDNPNTLPGMCACTTISAALAGVPGTSLPQDELTIE